MKRAWLAVSVAIIAACSGGPYDDLESKFASSETLPGRPIAAKTVVLTSKNREGAFNYKNTMAIRLSPAAVEITPTGPMGLAMKAVRIPRDSVALCSETCFGTERWDANLLIPELGVEISVPESGEVINWCWEQRRPIASAKARRDWMYGGKPLPEPSALVRQFSSRAEFDHAARQACLGY